MQHCGIKYKMHKKNIIKKIASFVMLLVFVISITPTVFFHNWLAKHTDSIRKSFTVSKEQVGKKTYHCNCNTLVVESPFKPSINHIILSSQPIFSIPQLYKTVYLFNANKRNDDTNDVEPTFGGQYINIKFLFFSIL